MKKLQYLTIEEQKNIQGGDWIKELGAKAHMLWCSIKSSVTSNRSSTVLG